MTKDKGAVSGERFVCLNRPAFEDACVSDGAKLAVPETSQMNDRSVTFRLSPGCVCHQVV